MVFSRGVFSNNDSGTHTQIVQAEIRERVYYENRATSTRSF